MTVTASCLPANRSYLDLANEAILSLQKRSGSSLQAIKQHIRSQYPDLDLKSNYLRAALKKAINDQRIVKVKASFKLAPSAKKLLMRRRLIMSNVLKAQSQSHSQSQSSPTNKLNLQQQPRTKQQSKQVQPTKITSPSSPSSSQSSPSKRQAASRTRTSYPNLRSNDIKRRLRSSISPSYSPTKLRF